MTAAAARAGTALALRAEFGPLDAVSDIAYGAYMEGSLEAALEAVRGGLVLTDAAGDAETGRYLRYIRCLALELAGDWPALRETTTRYLDELGADAGPYWRAKFLGLRSHALLQLDDAAEALAALAEGYGLVLDHPGGAYNRGSACHAVTGPLATALLFDPALEVMRTAVACTAGTPFAAVVVHDLSLIHLVRGLLRELLGRDGDADADYARAASLAVRAGRLAARAEDGTTALAAAAALQCAYQRLRCEPVDVRLLEQHRAVAGESRDGLLSTLVLSSVRAREGDWDVARRLCAEVSERSTVLGELVLHWVSVAWVAQLDEAEHGSTPATRLWRQVATDHLEELLADREGRFEGLLEWWRVGELRRRRDEVATRLGEDPLTRVGNRRRLDDVLADARAACRPVVFLDVDRFKAVNDDLGHDVGDAVLVAVAEVLRRESREGDVVVRYGGDEFVVLLEEGSDPGHVAGRVRAALAAVDWHLLGLDGPVTVTAGVARGGPGALERADADLRRLKAARAPVVVAPRGAARAEASAGGQ